MDWEGSRLLSSPPLLSLTLCLLTCKLTFISIGLMHSSYGLRDEEDGVGVSVGFGFVAVGGHGFAFRIAYRAVTVLNPSSNSTPMLFIVPRAHTRQRWPLRSPCLERQNQM